MLVERDKLIELNRKMVKYNIKKLDDLGGIEAVLKKLDKTADNFKADFDNNTDEFKKVALKLSRLFDDCKRPTPTGYSSVVLAFAKFYETEAKLVLATTSRRESVFYDKDKEKYTANPENYNSSYVQIEDEIYEYFDDADDEGEIVHFSTWEVDLDAEPTPKEDADETSDFNSESEQVENDEAQEDK